MNRAFISLVLLLLATAPAFSQHLNTLSMEEMQVLDSNRVTAAEESGLARLYAHGREDLDAPYLIFDSREKWDEWTAGLTWKPDLDPQQFDTHTLVLAETVFGCRSSHGVLTHLFYEAEDPETPIVVFYGMAGQVARCISHAVEAAWVPREVGAFKVRLLDDGPDW